MKIIHKQDVLIRNDHDLICFFIENPEGLLTRKTTDHFPEETYYVYKPHRGIFEVLESELAYYEDVYDLKSLRKHITDAQRIPLEYIAESVYQEFFCVSEIEECHEIKGIPWDIIMEKYKYAAMDKKGDVFIYAELPYIRDPLEEIWNSPKSSMVLSNMIKPEVLTLPKTEHWGLSLTVRPE